jgi:hypothetical protein
MLSPLDLWQTGINTHTSFEYPEIDERKEAVLVSIRLK